MGRRNALAPVLPALLVLALLRVGVCAVDLTILHTNDVHAHFVQFDKYAVDCDEEEAAAGECFGGTAREYFILINPLNIALSFHSLHGC